MQNADDEGLMRETLDAIYGPEDEMKADETQIRDEEADLLEKIPLPGDPTQEKERKKLYG